MEWVKLTTDYFRDLAIALGDDALEVMFTRGLALAGEIEQSGFIPDALLPGLTRRPALAKKTAQKLVKADLWERVPGGYQIVNWSEIQAELERLVAKKKRDKERKRRDRAVARESGAVSAPVSAPASVDESAPASRGPSLRSSESEVDAAAAAAAPMAIDPVLDVLRVKLQAHTRLQALRFDTLTPPAAARLVELVELHGDDRLVKVALDTCRATPPVHVSAFLGTWEALPPPGQRLRAVEQQFCTTHTWQRRTTAGVCPACESERIAKGANA